MSRPPLVIPSVSEHTATVIIVHGLGGDGQNWKPVVDMFRGNLPHVKWVLPNAPVRPISAARGQKMPAWYDLSTYDLENSLVEDEANMFESVHALDKIILEEVHSGISESRIVVGGFSQGASMSFLVGLTAGQGRNRWKPGGIAVMGARLPLQSKFASLASAEITEVPIFWGHRQEDAVVKYSHGCRCAEQLKTELHVQNVERDALGSPGLCFVAYEGLAHAISDEELGDLKEFLERTLPAKYHDNSQDAG
ncbi:Phospholipase/carboxylesterase/thioesterase [Phlebopus sp. FC_14]|nr:Phospholipase/carboxylesterase/thioesterase [Phlebopus sp. FC_14]